MRNLRKFKRMPTNLNNLSELDIYGSVEGTQGLKAGLHTLFRTSSTSMFSHYRLFIDEFDESSIELHTIFNQLINSMPNDTLEVRLNSPGGIVSYGIPLINIMNNYFHERTVTIIDSIAASMAAMVFISGYNRFVHPESTLMFHEASYAVSGKSSEIKNRADFERRWNERVLNRLLKDYFDSEEINAILNGANKWIDAQEMCERGLATGVIVKDGLILSPEEFLLFCQDESILKKTEDGEFYVDLPEEEPQEQKPKKKASKKKETNEQEN